MVTAPSGFFQRVRGLMGLVRTLKIDLIHISNIEAEPYGAAVSRLTGVPAIATLTNTADEAPRLVDNPHLNRAKLAAVRNMRKIALRGGYSHFIAISEHVRASTIDHLGLPTAVSG